MHSLSPALQQGPRSDRTLQPCPLTQRANTLTLGLSVQSFELLSEVFHVIGMFATCRSVVLSLLLSKAEVPSAVPVYLKNSFCSLGLCLLPRVTDTSGSL